MPPGPHLDACTAALAHRVGDSRSGRVDHGHEAHEAEVVGGEVHVVTVEGKALGELLLGQVAAIKLPSWPESVHTHFRKMASPVIHSVNHGAF